MLTAQEATKRSKAALHTCKDLTDAERAIRSASADGMFSKRMRGSPWDSPASDRLGIIRERLEKAGYVVIHDNDGTLITWG